MEVQERVLKGTAKRKCGEVRKEMQARIWQWSQLFACCPNAWHQQHVCRGDGGSAGVVDVRGHSLCSYLG